MKEEALDQRKRAPRENMRPWQTKVKRWYPSSSKMIQMAVAPPSTPAEMFLFLHRNTLAAAKRRIEMNTSGTIIYLRLHSLISG
jgi:hypothetical protein